jgi:hypothetical protein
VATVNRRDKYTRHRNPYVEDGGWQLFIAESEVAPLELGAGQETVLGPCQWCQWELQTTYSAGTGGAGDGLINKAERGGESLLDRTSTHTVGDRSCLKSG